MLIDGYEFVVDSVAKFYNTDPRVGVVLSPG